VPVYDLPAITGRQVIQKTHQDWTGRVELPRRNKVNQAVVVETSKATAEMIREASGISFQGDQTQTR
jgi:hypothetical protein